MTPARTSWRYGAPNAREYCRRKASAFAVGLAPAGREQVAVATGAERRRLAGGAGSVLTLTEPRAPSRTFWTSDGSRTAAGCGRVACGGLLDRRDDGQRCADEGEADDVPELLHR